MLMDWTDCEVLPPDSACVLRCMLKSMPSENIAYIGNIGSPIYELFTFLMRYEANAIIQNTDTKHFFYPAQATKKQY
jgi:hypothetical protein